MFPTTGKSKIPSFLAYPLHAKTISDALSDVPQASELSLWFIWYSAPAARKTRSVPAAKRKTQTEQPVIYVWYSYRKTSSYMATILEEGPKWEIQIRPVSLALKPRVAQLLQQHALPKMRDWLFVKREITGQQQSQSLGVYYNEDIDALEYKEHFHL